MRSITNHAVTSLLKQINLSDLISNTYAHK